MEEEGLTFKEWIEKYNKTDFFVSGQVVKYKGVNYLDTSVVTPDTVIESDHVYYAGPG